MAKLVLDCGEFRKGLSFAFMPLPIDRAILAERVILTSWGACIKSPGDRLYSTGEVRNTTVSVSTPTGLTLVGILHKLCAISNADYIDIMHKFDKGKRKAKKRKAAA